APDDADQYSQDLYRSLRIDNDGLHVLVGRLEPDSSLVAEVTLERYLIIDHGHDALAVLRFLLLADRNVIPIVDVALDHGLPAHSESKVIRVAEQFFEVQALILLDRLSW